MLRAGYATRARSSPEFAGKRWALPALGLPLGRFLLSVCAVQVRIAASCQGGLLATVTDWDR
jgi:hypothetical protein